MKYFWISLWFMGFSVLSPFARAEKAPFKFGKVSMEELQMKSYAFDTSASAVYLFKYGYFNPNQFTFTTQVRIKIFKKEGYEWANMALNVDQKSMIRGYTYNLENGKIVETKLKSESIFKDNVTRNSSRFNVTMPNVKEGSVVDIEYTIDLLPDEWRFQEEIPVIWSELVIEPNQYVSFSKNYFGFESLSINSANRWVAKDMPAFRKEPYMSSINNYISKFEFDILDVMIPGYTYQAYTTSWKAVANRLMKSKYFGEAINSAMFLNGFAKDIKDTCSTPEERMHAAFKFIKQVKWNDDEDVTSSNETLSVVFKNKTGNSADINLMLLRLLRKLDIEAYPVVISTRSNGIISPARPSINKLNYVVVVAYIDKKPVILDATEAYAPVDILPERILNGSGVLVDYDRAEFIDIHNDKKDRSLIYSNLTLDDDLNLTGTMNYFDYDYAALDFRKGYNKFNNQEDYLADVKSKNKGLSIKSYELKGMDTLTNPIEEDYKVKISNHVIQTGDSYYLNPMLLEQLTENPFKQETRKYPVDIIEPYEKTYVATITLPGDLEVTDIPKAIILKLPDNTASCKYSVSAINSTIQVVYKFNINKSLFLMNEYPQLRELFNQIVKKQAEPVILKKKA